MDSSYINDWAPIDNIINSSSSSNNNIDKVSSKVGAYDNYNSLQNGLSASATVMNNMKDSSGLGLELFRRLLLVDGGGTTAASSSIAHQAPFNMIIPFLHQQAHPSSFSGTCPLSPIKPSSTSSPKRRRDSNTLTHVFKEQEEQEEDINKGEEEMKGKKVRKKVKSTVKRKEEMNMEEGSSCKRGEEEEEEEEGGGRGQKKEREGVTETNRRGGGGGGGVVHSKTSSTHTTSKPTCTTKNGSTACKRPPPPPPPPLAPKSDFIHVRARRGQATDSHSLAERVRREKISERMRFLQDLVPGCSKITGKAMMLDEIINYVQSLQHQVEFLAMKLADLHPKQIAINADDSFMEEEIALALAEVQGTCLDVDIQAMESDCPTYHTQMHDLSSIFNMRFCDDEDVPFH